jgi:hypothetical protein
MFENEVLVREHLAAREREVAAAIRAQSLVREAQAGRRRTGRLTRFQYWTGGMLIGAGRYLQSKRAWGNVAHG